MDEQILTEAQAVRERTSDPHYAFGTEVIVCPECGHGIDPHGVEPGGRCGVGDANAAPCECLMQPNGIVTAHLSDLRKIVRLHEQRLNGVDALAEKWETATELGTGSPSIVARAFAEELRKALGGNDVQ